MNLLMLTDFSSHARHAHEYALSLYKNKPINVILLHVKKPCLNSQKCSGKCKIGLHQKVVKDAESLREHHSQTHPKAILAEGSFIEEIRAAVLKFQIDVLVIGAKGKSTNAQQHIGTQTQAITTKVKCPALVVFENTPISSPKSILFPVNYTDALYPVCLEKLNSLPTKNTHKIKILELKSVTNFNQLALSSKKILEENLNHQNTEFKNFSASKTQLIQEAKNYDLMVYAAKNLSVGNQIFSELKSSFKAKEHKTPLFVLHG